MSVVVAEPYFTYNHLRKFLCRCGVNQDTTDKYCSQDNAVSSMISDTSCGFTIGTTKPEHTGRWFMTAQAAANPSVQTAQV